MTTDTFNFDGKPARTVHIDDEPWFVGKDVCACLDISDHHQALGRLDADEVRGSGYNIPTPSGDQTMKIISEPGVYRLIFTSRTEMAERFKRWLAHDVLPALRRTGRYEMPARVARVSRREPLDSAELLDLRHSLSSLAEYRRLYGMRAARDLATRMPVPVPELRFRRGECHVEAFADDAIIREIGERISAADLYAAYVAWCRERGRGPMTCTGFGRRMRDLGYGKYRSRGNVVYTDITFASPGAAEPDSPDAAAE